MKKEILEALKAKFQGVNDKILDRIADKLAKTAITAEEVKTAVDGVTFQQVLESYGDSRATEAQQTAVTNYEKKHGLKDGKKVEGEEKPKPNEKPKEEKTEDMPEWAKSLVETNKAMAEELAAMKGEKVANTRKASLDAILKDAPETVRTRYEKDFSRMTFKDDDDFKGWIDEITPDVEKITTDFSSKGGVVGRPKTGGAGGTGAEKNPYLEARIKEREAVTSSPAIQGLTTETNN